MQQTRLVLVKLLFLLITSFLFSLGCDDGTAGQTGDSDSIDAWSDIDVIFDGDEDLEFESSTDGDSEKDLEEISEIDTDSEIEELADADADEELVADGDEDVVDSAENETEDDLEQSEADDDPEPEIEQEPEFDDEPELEPELEPEPEEETAPDMVQRVVIAGDSWSAGFVPVTIDILADRGYPIEVTYEETAVPGSKASEWVANEDNKALKLAAALDADPPAGILILVLGGNDINAEIADGYGSLFPFMQNAIQDRIADDLQTIVSFALADRPHLKVIIIGYDYLHYDFLEAYLDLRNIGLEAFNAAFIAHGERKLAIARSTYGCEYAHNFGILQHTYGDVPHPPFTTPLVSYPPGFAPAPGIAPDYIPFPGGLPQLPGPLDYLPDGIHPNYQGFRTIMEHSFGQGLDNLIHKRSWVN